VGATDAPVSADLEDCFAGDPAGVAETVRLALDAGLAGCSIEDWSAAEQRLYDKDAAAERVAAAAQVAHSGPVRLVLTARAENYLRGNPDLGDTIARLQAYQQAGADVLYAPALDRPEDLWPDPVHRSTCCESWWLRGSCRVVLPPASDGAGA
jgi:2-methylisocitrate lyase-like PEP mutase family enzyme